MRRIAKYIPLLFLIGMASCSSCERAEGATAEVMAAQMEGRRAAREFVCKQWRDTVELQHQLLEAKARQSRYLIEGKPECAAAFDTAFLRTIRVVRPELAKELN